MKKAVIVCGSNQFVVSEGDQITVNFMDREEKEVSFQPVMIVDGKNSIVDSKELAKTKVTAKVVEQELKGDKVVALRYKAKKRVNTKRGHRQKLTKLEIVSIK